MLRCGCAADSRNEIGDEEDDMDAHRIALVQQTFEKVAALGEKLPEAFYTELFSIDPSLRAMFDGDMRRQHMKFLMTLALVVRSLHAPEKILQTVQNLAIKHARYGVRPEHYTPFGNALLRTLKKMLGAEYTREVSDAWEDGFRMLAKIMKQAAYATVARDRKAHVRRTGEPTAP
jgi:hemoglobin-like flavoprotein